MSSLAVKASEACTHCGLPVPEEWMREPSGPNFCCAGCRAVYQAIHANGLEHYYEIRDAGAPTVGLSEVDAYDELDDEKFLDLYCSPDPTGAVRTRFHVEGLHCPACVWLLERAARNLPGVRDVRVDFGRSRLRVIWRPDEIAISEVARRFARLGYPVRPYKSSEQAAQVNREDRRMLVRIGVSGAVAGNVCLLAIALYSGAFQGIARDHENLFRWASLILSIPAVWFGGGVFFRGAWRGLLARTLPMDLPISLGISVGFLGGAYHTVRGFGDIYFDSVTALIFLLLIGRFLQRRQYRRALEAVEVLASVTPRRAKRVEANGVRVVLVESLAVGDEVEVGAGDVIPADGELCSGESHIDLSLLTGEARPVRVAEGAELLAGSTNLSSRFRMSVRATGDDTRIGRLLHLAQDQVRSPVVQLADRLAGWFVAVVLFLGVVTFALWSRFDPSRALDHTLALLVVSCPCALGLATPLAVAAALGKAARRGILIRSADLLDRLLEPGVVWFDKTGTLTESGLVLHAWLGADSTRERLAAVERQSQHPIAGALCRGVEGRSCAESVIETPGRGIRGVVGGVEVAAGKAAFVEEATGSDLPREWSEHVQAFLARGWSPVVVAEDGVVVAVAALGSPLRAGARSVIRDLKSRGWEVGILSGDAQGVVTRLGEALGISPDRCLGDVTPEQKLVQVRSEIESRPVVMIGDGVNDAAALAAASVGIAVQGGAEASLLSADAYLVEADIHGVLEAMDGARRAHRVIRKNVLFSVAYNFVGASLAMAGVLGPLSAAVLMPISSLIVITHSFRAHTFDPERNIAASPEESPRSRLAVGSLS